MPIDQALLKDYLAGMRAYGTSEVQVTLTVYELSCVVSLIQIGLKSPQVQNLRRAGRASRTADVAAEFVKVGIDALQRASPAVAAVARAAQAVGFDG